MRPHRVASCKQIRRARLPRTSKLLGCRPLGYPVKSMMGRGVERRRGHGTRARRGSAVRPWSTGRRERTQARESVCHRRANIRNAARPGAPSKRRRTGRRLTSPSWSRPARCSLRLGRSPRPRAPRTASPESGRCAGRDRRGCRTGRWFDPAASPNPESWVELRRRGRSPGEERLLRRVGPATGHDCHDTEDGNAVAVMNPRFAHCQVQWAVLTDDHQGPADDGRRRPFRWPRSRHSD